MLLSSIRFLKLRENEGRATLKNLAIRLNELQKKFADSCITSFETQTFHPRKLLTNVTPWVQSGAQ